MSGERMTSEQVRELRYRAEEHIYSVSYKVSLRWVFYRLLQDGLYHSKDDWTRWKQQASIWRHSGFWDPDILADETRSTGGGTGGIGDDPRDVVGGWFHHLDFLFAESHFHKQDQYVEVWFEARAMTGQFQKHTEDIVLVPFGGDPSIPYKYEQAKRLESMHKLYGKPITVLYFGDCDDKGRKIPQSAIDGPRGLRKWCDVDFDVVWCGLTPEQATAYNVPAKPENPEEYQWEALTDSAAQQIITNAIDLYIDTDLIAMAYTEASQKAQRFTEVVRPAIDKALIELEAN